MSFGFLRKVFWSFTIEKKYSSFVYYVYKISLPISVEIDLHILRQNQSRRKNAISKQRLCETTPLRNNAAAKQRCSATNYQYLDKLFTNAKNKKEERYSTRSANRFADLVEYRSFFLLTFAK